MTSAPAPEVTDCHVPNPQASDPPVAALSAYRAAVAPLTVTRSVDVTPSRYGTGNRSSLHALGELDPSAGRGVAVIDHTGSDREVKGLDEQGIRAVRFNVASADGAGTMDDLKDLSARAACLGWHVEIYAAPSFWVEHSTALPSMPSPIVVDHMGRIHGSDGIRHPAFTVIRRLVSASDAWRLS